MKTTLKQTVMSTIFAIVVMGLGATALYITANVARIGFDRTGGLLGGLRRAPAEWRDLPLPASAPQQTAPALPVVDRQRVRRFPSVEARGQSGAPAFADPGCPGLRRQADAGDAARDAAAARLFAGVVLHPGIETPAIPLRARQFLTSQRATIQHEKAPCKIPSLNSRHAMSAPTFLLDLARPLQ